MIKLLISESQLDDQFQDWYRQTFGQSPTAATLTHCRREVMQSVWGILLDAEFIEAYENGVVVTMLDGIKRCVFPRIFTYSCDYPEK